MKTWRHYRAQAGTRERLDEVLDERGSNGWELVHIERIVEMHQNDAMTDALSEPKAFESWLLFFKQAMDV